MKAVIYVRHASDNQFKESVERQIRECREYAQRENITVLGTYIDHASSSKTINRPAFQQMLSDSQEQLFDVIIFQKPDRFARKSFDFAQYASFFKENGVTLVSAENSIPARPENIFLESVLESIAEHYSTAM